MLCSKFFHPALFSKQYVVVYEFAYDCLVLTISGSKILCKSRFYCKPGAFFNAGFESAIWENHIALLAGVKRIL